MLFSAILTFLLDLLLQQGDGNNGGGQETVPVPLDGMRAPPATEADVDVRRASARPGALTQRFSRTAGTTRL